MSFSFLVNISFLAMVSSLVCYLLRSVFIKNNFFDKPKLYKVHDYPVPKGYGIIFNFFLFISFYIYYEDFLSINDELIPRFWFLFSGFIFFTLFSFIDDFYEINSRIKLYFQIAIIYLSISTLPLNLHDVINNSYFNFIIPFKIIEIILIFIWIFIINVTNFYDGVDRNLLINLIGINSGLLIISKFYEISDSYYFISLILLIFSLFGLLNYFKFNRFFLGDSGSIPLGYILGWLLIISIYKGFLIEVFFLCFFIILDVVSVLIFKIIKKENIFVRHNDFLFHQLFLKLNKNIFKHNLLYFILYFIVNLTLLSYLYKSNFLYLFILFYIFYLFVIYFNIKRISNK